MTETLAGRLLLDLGLRRRLLWRVLHWLRLVRLGLGTVPVPPIGMVTTAQTELTSLVIVAQDNGDITADCLESIYAHTHRSLELVLVDNGASGVLRATAATLRDRHGNVTYIRAQPGEGYARACNQGLAAARGEYLGILHDDLVVTPGWLGRLLAAMAIDPSVALAGPALSQSNNVQSVNLRTYGKTSELPAFSRDWAANHNGEIAIFKPLSGACLVLRRQVLDRIGGLDEAFVTGLFADDDFCMRAFRADFRMAIVFSAFVHHCGAAAFKRLGVDRKRASAAAAAIFRAKWGVRDDEEIAVAVQRLAAQPFDPARDRVSLGQLGQLDDQPDDQPDDDDGLDAGRPEVRLKLIG